MGGLMWAQRIPCASCVVAIPALWIPGVGPLPHCICSATASSCSFGVSQMEAPGQILSLGKAVVLQWHQHNGAELLSLNHWSGAAVSRHPLLPVHCSCTVLNHQHHLLLKPT